MAMQQFIETSQAVHQAASALAALEYLDQEHAQQLGPLAEAVANMFMVVFYQAETGQATQHDFQEAIEAVRQSLTP
ncbi:type I toxin-antitoxin system ptaRNA1 family toxin [Marinobacter shengliensis]|jgi:hypothetical protein|uniref:type I toxin-antitoxin system ptaRNA1 family toxin n=1 Tax=Marinobacter shengliensis TaxID=1389223 RepID=UPI002573CDB1|nr:type I toxin-antitoxin system ptaRNA1 family toxin [Marinobacter shengliensis]BEH16715.1 hypothetical protein MAALD49_40830 [Marinobacter shengliensis]